MEIIIGVPPRWEEIDAAFHVAGKPVIFAFGDKIYNPYGGVITPALESHEQVHGLRQTDMGVDLWWDKYLADPEFRLCEELPAHLAEYKKFCTSTRDRALKARYRHDVAARLAGPLYGNLLTIRAALAKIA